MNRLKHLFVAGAVLLSATAAISATQDPGLPVIEHNGQDCYFYTVKGSESVFGILSKFGWDEQVFMNFNPKAAQLKKGMIVYYPLPEGVSMASAPALPEKTMTAQAPADTAVCQLPIAAPESEEIAREPFIYTVKPGDTLYQLARLYHTSVRKLFSVNQGLTEETLLPGEKIRIVPGRAADVMRVTPVKEKKMIGKEQYKVQQGDSWESLAASLGISVDALKAVNDSEQLPRPGKKIKLPLLTDTVVYRTVEIIDPLEQTAEGRAEIYNQVHHVAASGITPTFRVTLLAGASAESKNRDLEFIRGFLLAMEKRHVEGYKLDLRVRRAEPSSLSATSLGADSVLSNSEMIITTYDKDFPAPLADFAAEHDIDLVNSFDARSDIFLSNPRMIQLLPPSADFYNSCMDFLLQAKAGSKFIFVAEDDSDGECISTMLLERLIRDGLKYETVDSYATLENYNFQPGQSYVVVSDLNKRSEITKLLAGLEASIDRYPGAQIALVGRPTWIVYADALKDKMQKCDTYIPSRFFLDPEQPAVQAFDKAYEAAYGALPVKSYPGYAAMGYDVANYFLNILEHAGGDINKAESSTDALQLDLRLERPENWSGLMNENVYFIHLTPYKTIDKLRL